MADALPLPDTDAAAHSGRLVERIVAAIDAAGGTVGFDRFMEMALYEPGLGYYSAGQPRFGAGGDYTTAPLTTPLFSRTLARQCAEVLARMDGGDILEFGAGTGRMAADILLELDALGEAPRRYLILEVSAALRQEQARTLADALPDGLYERVDWLERLPEAPLDGVILANEVLDALPVRRFQVSEDGLHSLAVGHDRGHLAYRLSEPDTATRKAVAAIEADLDTPLPRGYSSEYCPALDGWIGALADSLRHGVALLVDYGYPRREYYHPERAMGTLLCHYRHRAHDDALWYPGLQDITASVDFTAAARAACAAGLDVLGFTTQAHFLLGAGLPGLIEAEMAAGTEAGVIAAQQAKPLVMPAGMGERFKVLYLGRGMNEPLTGLSVADQTGRLGALTSRR
ncbi:SAM-dependent methyltransferase [Arhodomonas aquaeolei]|uniref:class I SAM-dependent methyltransferase n=1 Tax=Arhodomonas aquaeolei TaxID=2369 RepID=UPI0021695E3F|nr:SAM-dependent methyltransferase [Arhodomonas aquaeolei]MCS4505275.1 SAM-dependent methyltransferase [Arhodomonas aquaeolei]